MAADDLESYRQQVERLLGLADDYELSELDRDRVWEATRGTVIAGFDDPQALRIAEGLRDQLATAEREQPDHVDELRDRIAERLRVSF
jgi:hypothetical protein